MGVIGVMKRFVHLLAEGGETKTAASSREKLSAGIGSRIAVAAISEEVGIGRISERRDGGTKTNRTAGLENFSVEAS